MTNQLKDSTGYKQLFDHLAGGSRQRAASGLAPSETTGPAKVVAAVPTGSLPVCEAVDLANYWQAMRDAWNKRGYECLMNGERDLAIQCSARAETLEACAKQLRGHAECAMKRQPEENIRDDARPLGAVASGPWLGKPSENLTKTTNTPNA